MENTPLGAVRETVIHLVRECNDADLLDLLCKLLVESSIDGTTCEGRPLFYITALFCAATWRACF